MLLWKVRPFVILVGLLAILHPLAGGQTESQQPEPSSTPPATTPEKPAEEPVLLDEIVAKVNSDVITLTDLEREENGLMIALRQQINDPKKLQETYESEKRTLLRDIIRNKLMVQRAEEYGLSAQVESQVTAYLDSARQQLGLPDMESLDQAVRQQGSSLAEFRVKVREQAIIQALLQQYVYGKITLLTPELEAYYNSHQDQYTEPAKVDLAEIVLLTEGKDAAQVQKRAEEIEAKLKQGVPFEDLAREFSDGPTAEKGGAIGSFTRGSLDPSLADLLFGLKDGEITGILHQEFGFQILKVLAMTPATVKPFDEVRPQVSQAVYEEKARPDVDEFLKNLIEQSYIYIAPKYRQMFDVTGL